MPFIPAVLTDKGAEKYAKYPGGLLPFYRLLKRFRLGEGGWVDPGTGRVPRTPDPTLTTLDIITDATRPALSKRYDVGENFGYYAKDLVSGDFSFVPPSTLRIFTMILTTEYNFKNLGTALIYDVGGPYTNPEIWEIGLYDEDDDMIIYGTFNMELKDSARQVENIVRMTYAAG